MDIVLWNQSSKLEDAVGQLIAEACDLQMQEDVAPAYGLQPSPRVSFRSHTAKLEELPGNCLVIIFAEGPPAAARAAGVAGIQTAEVTARDGDKAGRNFARVYPETMLDNEGTILGNEGTISTSARSISATTSHECIEFTYDRNLQWWAWNEKAKKVVAAEVCDPVEEDKYDKSVQGQDVAVSNFVYPAWFDVRAPAGSRFDHMNQLKEAFSCSPGGYLLVYDPNEKDPKVHNEPPQPGWDAEVKEAGFARTRVRLRGIVDEPDRLVW